MSKFFSPMVVGVLCALAAGLCWGLVFVTPLWLSNYPADMLSFGRYLAFGMIALPIGWQARHAISALNRADWLEALKLSVIGNIIYYCAIAAAVQWAGAPSTSVLIGTLPVVIAICANVLARRQTTNDAPLPWAQLAMPLLFILAGLSLVNIDELKHVLHSQSTIAGQDAKSRYFWGLGFGLIALAAWTWYPIRNSIWIKANPQVSSSTWATAQGLATLPLAAFGFLASSTWHAFGSQSGFAWPLGPDPAKFVGLMFLLGFFASWLGTVLWNRASQLLPSTLAGQLIVFETLAALAYAYALRGTAPSWTVVLGVLGLVLGVVLAVRRFNGP